MVVYMNKSITYNIIKTIKNEVISLNLHYNTVAAFYVKGCARFEESLYHLIRYNTFA